MAASSSPLPARVLGTATLFLRPLRHLLDIDATIAVLRNPAAEAPLTPLPRHLHVRLNPVPGASTGESSLLARLGQVLTLEVRVDLDRGEDEDEDDDGALCVQYQLAPSTESVVRPLGPTHRLAVLVTEDLHAHVSSTTLVLRLLPRRRRPTPSALSGLELPMVAEDKAAAVASAPTPALYSHHHDHPVAFDESKAEAALAATNAAALAAEQAARAAERAAAAASAAMTAAQSTAAEGQRHEAETRSLEEAARERETARLQAELARAFEDKAALAAAGARLEAEAKERQVAMEAWTQQQQQQQREREAQEQSQQRQLQQQQQQQQQQTDQAVELLKQRMASDAKERDELQRRLRILEEEKLALAQQQRSRACVVQ